MVVNDKKKIVKAKDVQNALVKKNFHHEMYKQTLDEQKQFRYKQLEYTNKIKSLLTL